MEIRDSKGGGSGGNIYKVAGRYYLYIIKVNMILGDIEWKNCR